SRAEGAGCGPARRRALAAARGRRPGVPPVLRRLMLGRAGGRLPWHLRKAMRLRFALRERLKLEVTVPDGERSYRFVCGTEESLRRSRGVFSKEPGTIAWLRRDLRPGDTFLDIGANIGISTSL